MKYFQSNPSPFSTESIEPKPRTKKQQLNNKNIEVSQLDIIKCCFNFLKYDSIYFANKWKWSDFMKLYLNQGCELQRLYCNYILGILINLSDCQLDKLNNSISTDLIVSTENALVRSGVVRGTTPSVAEDEKSLLWNFDSNVVTNIEGVLLTIFNANNYNYFHSIDLGHDAIVKVNSTKINLRSLALGISSGRAICLSGPVGCGKTTLVEYLANKTGRVALKINNATTTVADKENKKQQENGHSNGKPSSKKRAIEIEENDAFYESNNAEAMQNGFLRIQLGDQTDSKMLLGQYRCTDTPGEFVWQPGVLTQV